MRTVGPKRRWGTWEELILGGAVLRHGCEDWNVVASELRSRTLFPSYFTPQVCKAKYEDLQKRYSGCAAWFEELRKRRVAELKRELKKSEDSIGSLESKIKRLKDEKRRSNEAECMSGQTESPASILRSDGNEPFGKDTTTSNDGLSAGSFTQDTRTKGSPNCQLPPPPVVDNTSKLEVSVSSELKMRLNLIEPNSTLAGTPRKRRGKRKRRDCVKQVKEEEEGIISFGESENPGSTSLVVSSSSRCCCNEASTSECGQASKTGAHLVDLMEVFHSFVQNKAAVVFRHRLDSQKRARYKRVIKQHRDFEMIKSRIINNSIKSAAELFRDLLLLANNALVFYSKRTKEYKSALSLRDDVLNACRQQHYKGSSCNKATNVSSMPLVSSMYKYNLPVKTWSARPRSSKRGFSMKIGADSPHGYLRRIDNIVDDDRMQLQQPLLKTNNRGFQRPGKMRNGLDETVPKSLVVVKDRKGGVQR